MNYVSIAKNSILEQSKTLDILAHSIPDDFTALVDYILQLKGHVIVTGIGKSGHIAKKIAASLASTGTPAFYVHPTEASHGDLGMITTMDMVIMLSNSGETRELFDVISYCKKFNIKLAAITMREESTLKKNSDFFLKIPVQKELSSISAPTTSSLMSLSLGDALVTTLHQSRGFTKEDFQTFHPGGVLGKTWLKVSDVMKRGAALPIIKSSTEFTEVIVTITEKRLGCAIVLNDNEQLVGIVTDCDIRRHIKKNLSNLAASDVMTINPMIISQDTLLSDALLIMNKHSITALPVMEKEKLIGVVHIHDILHSSME